MPFLAALRNQNASFSRLTRGLSLSSLPSLGGNHLSSSFLFQHHRSFQSVHNAGDGSDAASSDEPEKFGHLHQDIEVLMKNNKAWADDVNNRDPTFFDRLENTPKYLYFGCSDSRVVPEHMLGLEPGHVFVHRNVGNLIGDSDQSARAVIEFAVDVLGVEHILVTGHGGCAAVINSMKNQDLGSLENWLRGIRNVYRLHQSELDSIQDEEKRTRRLIELNVEEQCLNLFKLSCIQKKRKETGLPHVHGMYFDPSNGLISKLPIDFQKLLAKYESVYRLSP